MICMAMAFLPVFWAIPTESSGTPTRQLQWEQSMRSPAWQVLQDRTRLDISALKLDLSSPGSQC